jgi:hypothetical protein
LGPGHRTNRKNFKKLSKNDCLFTPSIFPVNEKSRFATIFVFNRVQRVHKPMPGNGAMGNGKSTAGALARGIWAFAG